jgi:hypothetical protein
MLDPSTLPNDPKFQDMENIIHTDEKWFNGSKKDKTVYMHPVEEDPHRTVRNKNAIDKVMFFSAVGRPRFDDEGRCYFDGKLGTWPFMRTVQTSQHMICNPCYITCHNNIYNFRNQQKEEVTVGRGAHLSQNQ